MTNQTTTPPDVFAKHRAMWASGDYASVADVVIPSMGEALVDAVAVESGERVLDVAAGSGNASLPAARRDARVTASDLTPELLEVGRRQAEKEGLVLSWEEANAEQLPYADGSFDVAVSCVGVMFAPHHQESADEIIRVLRPGGRIGLSSWTPEGYIGQMFGVMKPYAPPPPPGAQPPPSWGDEAHLAELFGDRVTDVRAERRQLRVDCFDTPEAFREFFKERYGPTISVYKAIADDPQKVAALDEALVDLAKRHDLGGGAMEWEYLLYTATRR
jgi:SAM-dependent methyltransferase